MAPPMSIEYKILYLFITWVCCGVGFTQNPKLGCGVAYTNAKFGSVPVLLFTISGMLHCSLQIKITIACILGAGNNWC